MQRICWWFAGHRRWRHHRTRIVFAVFSHRPLPERRGLARRCCHVLSVCCFHVSFRRLHQIKGQRVHWPVVRQLLPFVLLGSLTAGYVAPQLPSQALKLGFALFISIVSMIMFLIGNLRRTVSGAREFVPFHWPGAGLVSGLAGIAGGNVIVPTLIYFNIPPHQATATASTLGSLSLRGSLGYMLLAPASNQLGLIGYVDPQAFVFIVAGAVVAAPLGVRFAQRLPGATLKRIFAVMLLLVALRMVF